MRGGLAVVVVVLLALLGLTNAYQRAFYGGDFTQADGAYSPGFAVFDDNSKGWERVPFPGFDALGGIKDHYPVGKNGVFVVGEFSTINNGVPSFGVAFFDGHKWCAVRQGLAVNSEFGNRNNFDSAGTGLAVWCNSATSCYVAGSFDFIENTPDNAPNNAANFAHYIRESEDSSEWVFDSSITEWNSNSAPASPLGGNAIPGTLQGVPADDPEYFFVAVGSSDSYGTSGGFGNIFRGGKADGGWVQFLDAGSVFGSNLRGFDIDDTGDSPAVYVVSASGVTSQFAKKTTVVLRPCPAGGSCGTVTNDPEWTSLIPSPSTPVEELFDVAVVNSTTRYYIGTYSPGANFNTRYRVLQQDGFTTPIPVGAPFAQDTGIEMYRVSLHEGQPVVIGSFTTANLEYPADTEDVGAPANVDSADIRELDTVHYIAVYKDGEWTAHFGGGFGPSFTTDTQFAQSLIARLNPESNKWSFTSEFITFVYNQKAEGLAFFDDDSDLHGKNIYPLFTHRLVKRGPSAKRDESDPAQVFDVACEEDNCEWVYAGGDFGYHGRDLLGAVAKVHVRREDAEVLSVGGGLWVTDDDVVPTDPNLQFRPGTVYTLKSEGGWLYAGGYFGRGKNGYVCLNNVARIRHGEATQNGAWENLGGGCDDLVYDMQFWGDDLYLAGEFTNCGGTLVNYATAYNTNGAYQSLNNGLDGTAFSVEYFQQRMIFGGDFAFAGGLPVTGVASWDGHRWRALQPACTDDCLGSEQLQSYFTRPIPQIENAYSLRASKDGTALYARVYISGLLLLGQWKYFDLSDNGQWTVKGHHLDFNTDWNGWENSIMNNGTQLVVAGGTRSLPFSTSGLGVQAYSLVQENWVDNNVLVGNNVWVVRSSASTLTSFLSFLF